MDVKQQEKTINGKYVPPFKRQNSEGCQGLPSKQNSAITIHVKSIPRDVTDFQLRQLFVNFGSISRIYIKPVNKRPECDRNFAFIRFHNEESVTKAITGTNGQVHFGTVLEVSAARPK